MKKVLHLILIIGMFLGSLCFGVGLFCAEATKKEHLSEAIQQINMVEIVKSEIGDRYELIGELLDTKEFKNILGTYTDGFIDYVADGSGEIDISQDQLRDLFTNYSSILLKQYPELAFLPTDKFVDFLTESVNVEKLLPPYEDIMERIPAEALVAIRWMKAPWLVAGSLGLFLACLMIYLVSDWRGAFQWAGSILIILGAALMALTQANEMIFSLSEMQQFELAKPAIEYMLQLFGPIASGYLVAGAILGGGAVIGKKRRKKT